MLLIIIILIMIALLVSILILEHKGEDNKVAESITYILFHKILPIMLISLFVVGIITSNTNLLMYKGTTSKEEFNIDDYQEVTTTSEDNKTKVSYTYTIKNTDNCKTVSAKDDNVYSISASSSSSRVNHLTIKHIKYFNWATFTTTQKDEYIFSSKF